MTAYTFSPFAEDYKDTDRDYLQALHSAREEVTQGHAISYSVTYSHEAGREIHLQTDQGWNPYSLWKEFPEHEEPTNY